MSWADQAKQFQFFWTIMMNPNTLKLNWTTCKDHQNQKNENIPYLRPSLHLHSWSFPVQLPDKLNKVLSTLNLLQY